VNKLLDLKYLFVATGFTAFFFFIQAVVPPQFTILTTGWDLSADGQFVLKCAGFSMLTQAYLAWVFREDRDIRIAWGLAITQFAIGNLNWIMFLLLKDEGIFSTGAQVKVFITFTTFMHNILGLLLIAGIMKAKREVKE
jgi:hypothetical protein